MWGGGSCAENVRGVYVCGVPQAYICTVHIRTVHVRTYLHTYVCMYVW